MQTKNLTRKNKLKAQLKEVELGLKAVNQQFLDIKKRASESVSASRKRADTRKLSDLRKQLGIEK